MDGFRSSDSRLTKDGEIDKNDRVGTRFRLEPGNPRNPDYMRNPFMQQASNEIIEGTIKEAQLQHKRSQGNLFKPSFVYENKPTKPRSAFSEIKKTVNPNPIYVMAANGAPTFFIQEKSDDGVTSDLTKGVQSLCISESEESLEEDKSNADDINSKSHEDWKDELPIHLKSLKFMINLMNDRHTVPNEFASSSLIEIPPPTFGPKFRNMEVLNDTWSDSVFPYPGDRVYPSVSPQEVRVFRRPHPFSSTRSRAQFNRRRTKSADHDLLTYRDASDRRGRKHPDSDEMGNTGYRKRRSIDINGVYIVEELEEDEEKDLIPGAANSTENSSPARVVVNRIRRDFGNISPINEDMSESDKEGNENNNTLDSLETFKSSSANNNGGGGELSLTSRLNCSSPILSYSPSLRKTPVMANVTEDTPPSTGGAVRRVRNIARALDDISDREEEEEPKVMSSDEENTESFEIDLAAAGDGMDCLSASSSKELSKAEDTTVKVHDMHIVGEGGDNGSQPISEEASDGSLGKRTVWEMLSANIEAHIGDGNPAGFISGPIDHPLQVSTSPEPEEEYPSYMHYNQPLTTLPKLPY